jgi:hypothetical protein
MMKKTSLRLLALSFLLSGVMGCAANKPQSYDYSSYRQHAPKSVLVIPPMNDSVEADAPYVYLSTITRPLAECGYYVFPVAVVDALMKDNGMPTPGEMNAVPLDRIRDIVGADAVLYVNIEDWGQKYRVLASTTVVKARARLVDVETGTVIWEGNAQAAEGSGDGGGGLAGMLVAAVVDQVVDSATDRTHGLSSTANSIMVFDSNKGLPYGPYNPESASDPRR